MGYGFHYYKGEHLSRDKKVLKKVLERLRKLDWDDEDIDVSKDWVIIHLCTASQSARLLALKRGLDAELAASAGALHDIGLLVNKGMEKSHANNAYELAKEILREVGEFNQEEIELIASAAAKHSEKEKQGNWLEELMKDVDVFDCTLHGSDFSPFEHHFRRVKKVEEELGITIT